MSQHYLWNQRCKTFSNTCEPHNFQSKENKICIEIRTAELNIHPKSQNIIHFPMSSDLDEKVAQTLKWSLKKHNEQLDFETTNLEGIHACTSLRQSLFHTMQWFQNMFQEQITCTVPYYSFYDRTNWIWQRLRRWWLWFYL